MMTTPELAMNGMDIVLLAVACLVLFYGPSWLMDRPLGRRAKRCRRGDER